MQISTRDEDFLIDAIALHRSMGEALNEVFTNPRITKVMHGADAALQWLQRDLGIYVVGLFDTGQAPNPNPNINPSPDSTSTLSQTLTLTQTLATSRRVPRTRTAARPSPRTLTLTLAHA